MLLAISRRMLSASGVTTWRCKSSRRLLPPGFVSRSASRCASSASRFASSASRFASSTARIRMPSSSIVMSRSGVLPLALRRMWMP